MLRSSGIVERAEAEATVLDEAYREETGAGPADAENAVEPRRRSEGSE